MATVGREKLIYGWRDPVDAVAAATVILMRDDPAGLEILMTRRSLSASFAPGVYVFPGGQLDDSDYRLAESAAQNFPGVSLPDHEFPFAIAAIREAFEELGILTASRPDGDFPKTEQIAAMDRSPDESFVDQLTAHQLTLRLDAIQFFSHWITDRDLPKRFDTHFFVAEMPAGQHPIADEVEQFEPVWVRPHDALERHNEGQFDMILPTVRTLEQLISFDTAASVLEHCRTEPERWRSSPRAGFQRGQVVRFCEDEPEFSELELVTPDGSIYHHLDWQHEPVGLLRHVIRVTAPNPSPLTGPGTNTYLVGDTDGFVVVDPGPDDSAHGGRIAEFTNGNVVSIVCTHSHPDHSSGAQSLRQLLGDQSIPILGRPSGPESNPDWKFIPDRVLEDGDTVPAGDSFVLRVLETPGHASNHLCLMLDDDGLLFSGDHILNGSTTLIDHPDGNMRDYLAGLTRLTGEPIRYILPAHGHVLGQPQREIQRLIQHRLRRESKVEQSLIRSGGGNLDELVLLAYDDVGAALHPYAKLSLAAHLVKLVDEGRARFDGESWFAET